MKVVSPQCVFSNQNLPLELAGHLVSVADPVPRHKHIPLSVLFREPLHNLEPAAGQPFPEQLYPRAFTMAQVEIGAHILEFEAAQHSDVDRARFGSGARCAVGAVIGRYGNAHARGQRLC